MRKILISLLVAHSLFLSAFAQYWQQQVNYTIDVTLNDKDNTLDAFEKIEYINNSPDTLKFIWFHIWPNAYKNDQTAFSDQLLLNGNTRFYFSDNEEKGYINRLDFKVNDITADLEDHPKYIDIVKLILPSPLAPGQKCIITTPFHEKLPYNFSRGGHDGQSYQATQWYPKPAVYDKNGWHPMPYLDQGEFYSEFGNFDVSITIPKNYVVAATGELQNEGEKEWLKKRSSFSWTPKKEKLKTKGGVTKIVTQEFPPSAAETKTLRFTQNNIHDFAWFADKRFIVNEDTCRLSSGKIITAFTYFTPEEKKQWRKSIQYCKDAVRFYSNRVGEYPYNVVSAVQGPESFGGGMEYPTITIISPASTDKELDLTIAHEIGHNWFYGILASNERDHPWMDEGINSYYEHSYSQWKYGSFDAMERVQLETMETIKKDQPIENTSEAYSERNYDLVVYYKTSEWMRYVESQLGIAAFDKAMQDYYKQFQFKHPQPEDLKNVMAISTGQNMDSLFSYLNKTGPLPNEERKGFRFVPFFNPKSDSLYLRSSANNIFLLTPSLGFNSYDKLMIGGLFTNYKLPPTRFQFVAAPMYATGSKSFTGIGKLNYTFYPSGSFRKIDLFLNAATFNIDQYTDSAGKKTFMAFQKIVPGIRFTLKQKDPRSTIQRYIQWKTFLIGEDNLHFYRDTVINGIDTTISNKYNILRNNRVLNQLSFVIKNERALYPYSGELKIEQASVFVRTAFTGNYFFNYPKAGGLDVRLFAGKFFYIGSKTITKQFETDRYHLNMTGANGYEDYTYSDYFIGRNKFDGMASQQIMMRDGGFKVRTDLLATKVGKTDDWLIAANFSSSIPSNINPLNLLPVKIPLKIFADIGTYSEAWKPDSGLDRFLYDAGFQIPLLHQTINIFIPILYSNIYRDYFKSTLEKKNRWLHITSFSIDISNLNLKKLNKNLSLLDE
ncbi:MAG TPA: M1 family metallopeptidase [Chitinophagaceae bacterium]|nr:M1 family metallopeptidase [Chitinophagaceae bacterium]